MPGTAQPREQFGYEDLLRGTRVEVWDDATRMWHSLHERRVRASFDANPILDGARDTGYLQNPPLSRTPGNPTTRTTSTRCWRAGTGGACPRRGRARMVIHDDGRHGDAGSEHLTTSRRRRTAGLRVQSTAEPKSLPALRYGRRYSFRVAGVDLAGN